ncbi:P450-derived glycosyltransferase activator [Streptomyces sp. NPDC092370]|uniref:P450-derived glycosyltransferase activator n=1 Tax=Streptomyces sp. NPDC092370 TaxID=3366016 RepID=UPI0037F83CDE
MVVAEKELGRRLQLVQGIHWLYGVQGDPYAALLRGHHGPDPREAYARNREAGPLWRSRLGTWVSARYATAAELLALPVADGGPLSAAVPQPQVAVAWDRQLPAPDPAGRPAADRVRALAGRACERILAGLRGEVDLVGEVCARVPVEVLADLHGLAGADRERLARACAAAAPALDAALAPPSYEDAARLSDAVAALRGLLGEAAVVRAVVEVRAARELVAGALGALVAGPGRWAWLAGRGREGAAAVVAETLRHDPPVKVHVFTAAADTEAAGQPIAAGEQVAVLIGAANRDPEVFDRPDVFDPDRAGAAGGPRPLVPTPYGVSLEPFAEIVAETVVAALAAARPRMRAAGPAVRCPRTPVTGGLLKVPVLF